jgi:DNA-binding HxlR family transcriptional regulator
VRRTRFNDSPSPIARVTDLAGDWWTPLVLGELCFGQTRFDQIRARLGCSKSVLTQRLNRLIDEGLVTSTPTKRTRSATTTR